MVRPGGDKVLLKLRRILEAKTKSGQALELKSGQKLELNLVDADTEEILEHKTVSLKIDLDEWS
jgi:curli biogenesis system outer membrane secretion channel CsgG